MRYTVRRFGEAILLLWAVLTITFVLVHLAPGDPAVLLVAPETSGEGLAARRAELGLDRPAVVQYARWMGDALLGDLGFSFTDGRPVRARIAEVLPVSAVLGVTSLALSLVIGVALGAVQAARPATWVDRVMTVLTTAVYAAPAFWISLALIAAFTYGAARLGVPTGWRLPAFGLRDPASTTDGWQALVDVARHAILPVTVLAAVGAAGVARYARASFADQLSHDWVRTARAKGLTARAVAWRHVLRNALPPLLVLAALMVPGIVAGSVFVESVFAWPGMGRLMVAAVGARDYPLVLGASATYAAVVIGANLVAELLLPVADPRRR